MRLAPLLAALLAAAPLAAQPGAASRRAAAEGRFVAALSAHQRGDDAAAAEALDALLRDYPEAAAILDARAEVALAQGDAPGALYYAERAAEHAPDEPAVLLRLGEARRETGDRRGAAEALEAARRLDPSDPAPLVALADLYAEAGDAEAERVVLDALVRLGETPAARLRLSVLYERAGDLDRARAEAAAAVRLAPGEPAVRRRLDALRGAPASPEAAPSEPAPSEPASGEALHAAGRYAEAADALLDAVAEDPRRIDAWALALDALARTTDPRAGATADDALLLFPSVPAVLAPAADAYLAAGRPADARAAAERGLGALDVLGADAPDAEALRSRLRRTLAALD